MSKKFAVGDKVAVYNNGARLVGKVVKLNSISDFITVEYLIYEGTSMVPSSVYKKQCRHLRKKEKPIKFKCEWELSIAGPIFPTAKNLRETLDPLIGKQTRVTIEVLK